MAKNILWRATLWLLPCALAAGCGGGGSGSASAPPAPLKSGIQGTAMIGPIQPVSRPGEVNARPLADAILTVQPAGGGKERGRTKTNAQGRFRLSLPAGTYLVVPLPPNPASILPFGKPQTVAVAADKYVEITVDYDSGIR